MTVAEVTKLYDRIINQILHLNLKEAFSNLGYLIQLNGFGTAYDQLTEMENNYRYMLKYRLEGYPDPDRDKVAFKLQKSALDLADGTYHLWMTKNSSDYYYDRIRVDKTSESDGFPQLLFSLKESGEKQTMVELVEDKSSRLTQQTQISRLRERTNIRIFNKIWISNPWKEEDRIFMSELFNDPLLYDT